MPVKIEEVKHWIVLLESGTTQEKLDIINFLKCLTIGNLLLLQQQTINTDPIVKAAALEAINEIKIKIEQG